MEQLHAKPAFLTAVEDLRPHVEGAIILPNDPAYDTARLCWNRNVDQLPTVIVAALTAHDVSTAVQFARGQGLDIAVQGIGHGNVRPADDCLLILTNQMTRITIDPEAHTATVGAGVQWGPVLAAAQAHGLAPLLGSSPTVGVVGYTLGGGLGWLGRKYGLAADNVIAFELVMADGQQRYVSAEENSSLFWALRGGGGCLGVVTSLTFRLFPVTTVYDGNLIYPLEMAPEVFRRYRAWIANAPDELTSSVLIMNFPPVPELPPVLSGQRFVIVRGCYCGSIAEGDALLQTWRDWQPPLVDAFVEMPFSAAATISNDPVDPMPVAVSGAWLRELSDEAIETIVAYGQGVNGRPSPLIFAEVRHAGGAISRTATETAVFGNRDAELLLSLVGAAPTPDAHAFLTSYIREMKGALQPALTGGVYMNFLEGIESQQRLRDGLAPGGYERLARLKAAFDPENLFRYSFNVTG